MKFLADENIYDYTIRYLKSNGHTVLSIKEMDLSGAPDDKVFEIACQENCLLITLDKDFTDLRKYAPKTHPGIIVIRIKPPATEKIQKALENLFAEENIFDKIQSALVILEEHRYRIRKLPLTN